MSAPAPTPSAQSSDYLLLFRNAGPDTHAHLTPEQKTRLAQQWNDWVGSLLAQGKLHQGRPLALGGRVVAGAKGDRVTDGPYAEGKEVVGGYLIIKVAGLDEATAVAKKCPGLAQGLTVEVRPLADVSPVLTEVRGRPPV